MGGGASKKQDETRPAVSPQQMAPVMQAPTPQFQFQPQQPGVNPAFIPPTGPPIQIQVVVPGGFPPGSTFPVQYGGTMFNVSVPQNAPKGTIMNVQVPFQQAQPQYIQVGPQQMDLNLIISQFTNIDASGDGKLTLDEFRRGQANIMGAQYNDQMCCMMFQQLDSNMDGALDLREFLMGNGVDRQTAKAVMDSWRAQRKAVKAQIASERARQKAERELEAERRRNERMERQRAYGGGHGGFGGGHGGFGGGGYNHGYRGSGSNNTGGGGGGGEVGEYGGEGEEGGGEEEGGGDEEEGGGEVDMYGAAPQDLPDGGPSFGGGSPAVLSGAFAPPKRKPLPRCTRIPAKRLQKEILMEFKRRYANPASPLAFATPADDVHRFARLQSSKTRSASDITVVTQCSIDRLPRLREMCQNFDGCVSCCVYVPPSGSVPEFLSILSPFHGEVEAETRCKLDLQLRQEADAPGHDGLYPINALRNVALDAARTDRVLLLDVDFALSKGANALGSSSLASLPRDAALVVPAFEASARLPLGPLLSSGKAALKDSKEVTPFHTAHFPKGRLPTNYDLFFSSTSDYPTPYQHCYEPYVACHRSTIPHYDERFRGYGLNKVSHLLSLSRTHDFVVCSGAWCVSPEMEKSNAWERIYGGGKDPKLAVKVQVLFDRFRGELEEGGPKRKGKERRNTTENEKKADAVVAIDILLHPLAKKAATVARPEEEAMTMAFNAARLLAFGFGAAVVVGRAFGEWGVGGQDVEEAW